MKKSWGIISKNRDVVFGITILLIIVFHYFENVLGSGAKAGPIPYAAKLYNNVFIGSIGVEIFLLLSGVGIAFSLQKNSDIGAFYGRRFRRVLLPYLIWGGLYWAVVDFVARKGSIGSFLKDLFFVSLFTEGVTRLWFIMLILILYFLSPFLMDVLFYDPNRPAVKFTLLMALIMGLTALLAWRDPALYQHIEIALTRVPCYIAGLYIGKKVYEGKPIRHPFWILAGLVLHFVIVILKMIPGLPFSAFLKNSWPFVRWMSAWYAIALLFLLAMLLEKLKLPRVKAILALIGSYSLELYMTHVCIRHIFNTILKLKTARIRYYVLMIAVSVVCSILLKRTLEGIQHHREEMNDETV